MQKTNPTKLGVNECNARTFASQVHREQMWGPFFYIEHLDRVHHQLSTTLGDDLLNVAAYLHDVYEDGCSGDLTKNRRHVCETFGADTDAVVWAVSGFGQTRRTRQSCIIHGIAALPKDLMMKAVNLKLVDRIVNMGLCLDVSMGSLQNVDAKSRTKGVSMLDRYRQEDQLGYGEIFRMGNPALYSRYLSMVDPDDAAAA